MAESFVHELGTAEKTWSYIYIPTDHRELFPEHKPFEVAFKGESFEVTVSKAGRIVKEELVKKICKARSFVIIITKKNENEFEITPMDEKIRKIISP